MRGARDVGELRELEAEPRVVVVGQPVQHRGHRRGEPLRGPHAREAGGGVCVEEVGAPARIERGERVREHVDVGRGEVQALRAGRRHDVRGIAGEEDAAVLHRLDHDAAHRDHALVDDRALAQRPAVEREPRLELLPDARIGPPRGVVVGTTLEVQALQRRRARADQREPALVQRVDQLVGRAGRLREHAEPAGRVRALVGAAACREDQLAARTVEPVAAGEEVAGELVLGIARAIGDSRTLGVGGVDGDGARLEPERTAGGEARGDQILDHLVLGVQRDRATAREVGEGDAVATPGELQVQAPVDRTFAAQPIADADLGQEVDRALLEHAGANLGLELGAAAALEHDRLDPRAREQVREQQPSGAAADDSDLDVHLPEYAPEVGSPAMSIHKVLVANRGEIALRVMRTCRAMGIATVAVYSDADADAPFVRFADEAVRLGPPPARESYLVINAILDAARITGADAIHPGYGFLSENAAFAEAVAEAGLVFIGPPAAVIAKLGSKQAAKRIARTAGVPTVPGSDGDDQSNAALIAAARGIGYPLLVKASAGGGGKGMRVVRGEAELADAIERARGEATSAFGDGTLLLEKYLDRPRHIEIQILGDTHGNVVHLWERECSVQRRHQKVIEEAPSVALDADQRAAMGRAAVELGKAVGYVGAGTVEFIAEPSGAFYFLEVNTRLQVEHPVTELTTGLDLVREQLRIARGEPLGYTAAPPQRGWAIEVRLCAEDAERDYLPTTGTLLAVDAPATVRADLGVAAGSEIGIHYDSMLGKIIAHAPTRREAAQVLRRALDELWVPGVVTNREHLAKILAHPAFLAGELDTHFLERHAGELAARTPGLDRVRVAAIGLALWGILDRREPAPFAPPGWRNVPVAEQHLQYQLGDSDVSLGYRPGPDGAVVVTLGGKPTHVTRYGREGDRLWFVEGNGHRRQVRVATSGARSWVLSEGLVFAFVEAPRFPEVSARSVPGGLTAPMPGKVVKVHVAVGEIVVAGAALVVLEAMKMEHTVRAPDGGVVRAIHVAIGEQVDADRLLAVVTEQA